MRNFKGKLRPVPTLFVKCSFVVSNFDNNVETVCGRPATSAVEMSNGQKHWRCNSHTGLRTEHETGRVLYCVMITQQPVKAASK